MYVSFYPSKIGISYKVKTAGALQSTFIVKSSTPAKMYVSLSSTVFKCIMEKLPPPRTDM